MSPTFERLDAQRIAALLGDAASRYSLDLRECCTSTNSVLMDEASSGAPGGRVLACEEQTAGRGRRGRAWRSIRGGSLTFSVLWHFADATRALPGLSLSVGLAVAEALDEFGAQAIRLKWPNDILCGEDKLGGILIEIASVGAGAALAVIGIGLNIDLPEDLAIESELAPTDLRRTLGVPPSRNALLAAVLRRLQRALDVHEEAGFVALRERYHARAAYLGRAVVIRGEGLPGLEGRYIGTDADGALLLSTAAGPHRVLSGDVSVRPAP